MNFTIFNSWAHSNTSCFENCSSVVQTPSGWLRLQTKENCMGQWEYQLSEQLKWCLWYQIIKIYSTNSSWMTKSHFLKLKTKFFALHTTSSQFQSRSWKRLLCIFYQTKHRADSSLCNGGLGQDYQWNFNFSISFSLHGQHKLLKEEKESDCAYGSVSTSLTICTGADVQSLDASSLWSVEY